MYINKLCRLDYTINMSYFAVFLISDCLRNILNNTDTIEYIPLIGINTYGIVEAVVVVVGIISGK